MFKVFIFRASSAFLVEANCLIVLHAYNLIHLS